jgi:Secretion system C-terminal sorting domain
MKSEKLQQSELLAKHFAPYRAEAPLVSAPEIEKLLVNSAMLHTPTRNAFFSRRLFMTLSGIAGLAAISYFAFFNTSQGTKGTNTTQGPSMTQPSHTMPDTTELSQFATPASIAAKHTILLRKTDNPRGPWSAGNDQFYADLSPEELAKLGIMVAGDTIFTYKIHGKDSVVRSEFSEFSIPGIKYKGHSIGGAGMLSSAPPGVDAHSFYPILMTYSNGNGAAYRIENGKTSECGMIGPEDLNKVFRDWLEKPGTSGLCAFGFETSSIRTDSSESDTVKISIGKNLSQPTPFPLIVPEIDSLSKVQKDALIQLAHYYDGTSATKPEVTFPKNITVRVDTLTARNLLDQMDAEENGGVEQHLRSIMARLNELVPVIVRPKGGSGAPDSNDYIFWYEPSEELFNALPQAQATIFRTKLAEPPHCLTSPNAVLTQAEITFCVDRQQTVHITVRDLTGKKRISWDKAAIPGDNIDTFSTATLASGMYLITVKDTDENERTRRIWIENAHPKKPGWEYADMKPDADHAMESFTTFGGDTSDNIQKDILSIPHLELDNAKLASIGVESNDSLAAFYHSTTKAGTVNYVGVLRNSKIKSLSRIPIIDGVKPRFLQQNDISTVTVPAFHPMFVTDGRGVKRVFLMDFSDVPTSDAAENRRKFHEMDKKFEETDQLIPILLRADNTSDSVGSRDLIFWYKPTPEFLAALPDSARAIAQTMASGTTSAVASVTDVHGAIQQAVSFPNPSKGKFSVQLTLSGARTLTFTLRNLLGQPAAPPVQARMDGTGEQSLDFSVVAEGVYLLDISSDQGERYIERVVIAH